MGHLNLENFGCSFGTARDRPGVTGFLAPRRDSGRSDRGGYKIGDEEEIVSAGLSWAKETG